MEAGYIESLAHPGGNVTGPTNLTRELGGKRLELLKEAVPKLGRVAVLYDPTSRPVYTRRKRISRSRHCPAVDTSTFGRTGTDDFESAFAALNKERPDGLYMIGEPPLIGLTENGSSDFAVKNRLPSIYNIRDL